jgi:hypothetical protein
VLQKSVVNFINSLEMIIASRLLRSQNGSGSDSNNSLYVSHTLLLLLCYLKLFFTA